MGRGQDMEQIDQLRKDVSSGLENINEAALPCEAEALVHAVGLPRHRGTRSPHPRDASGSGSIPTRGGSKVSRGSRLGKARPMDDLGGREDEEDLLAGIVGYSSIQDKLYHQVCLRCLANSQRSLPVLWARSHLLPLPDPSYTETYLGGLKLVLPKVGTPGGTTRCCSVLQRC